MTERKRVLAQARAEEPFSSGKHLLSDTDASARPQKTRKVSVTAKKLGLTKEEWNRLKPEPLKKMLKQYSKQLAKQVERDWWRGYDEQVATVSKWATALHEPLQAVLDIGVGKRLAIEQCNDVLCLVGDNWRDMCATPCRVSVAGMMGSEVCVRLRLPWGREKRFNAFFLERPLEDMVGFVWRVLLRVAAIEAGRGDLSREVVFRGIRDAVDNGVTLRSGEVGGWADIADGVEEIEAPSDGVMNGNVDGSKLDALVEQGENWKGLESRIRVFRMRERLDPRGGKDSKASLGAEEEDTCAMQ